MDHGERLKVGRLEPLAPPESSRRAWPAMGREGSGV